MGKAKKKPKIAETLAPTPEQIGAFVETWQTADGNRAQAYRRIPVIDTLSQTGKLTPRQFNGLARYRDVAIAEERSPMRDSLDKALHGRSQGLGIPASALRTAIELGRLERELGALRDIARAVAVDDTTPSQWAMQQSGSVERSRANGPKVVTWFEPRRAALKLAMLEVRFAGDRLAAAIGA